MAKTPTTKPASAIDAPPPASASQPWATPAAETSPVETPTETPSEPPAGTPLTPEELAANSIVNTDETAIDQQAEEDEPVQPVEPAEVREQPADTNGNTSEDDAGHQDANGVGETPAVEPTAPVEDKLTLGQDGDEANTGDVEVPEDEPTGDDGRPDGFVPGDQTAAGALTPPGGQHPGAPKGLHPGQPINLQDPYNVNGTQRNQELLAAGHGIKNPLLDQPDPNVVAAQSDAEDAKDD